MLGTVFFFTNWGFLLLTLYFASIVVYSLRPPPVAAEGARPPRWQQLLWLHFEVAGMSAIFIDAVLWGVLWPAAGFTGAFFAPMMLVVHAANALLVLAELALNRLPVNPRHYCAVVGYTACYGLWATLEHVVFYGGRRGWPYFFCDVETLGSAAPRPQSLIAAPRPAHLREASRWPFTAAARRAGTGSSAGTSGC